MFQPGSFPFVLGTDIVAISRFRRLFPSSLRKTCLRVLHPFEVGQIKQRYPEWYELLNATPDRRVIPKDNTMFTQWLAGRWAAKEAAKKAWGAGLLGFRDVYVSSSDNGRPYITCAPWGRIVQNLDDLALKQVGALSISHDGDYATATVMAEPLQQELRDVFVRRKQSVLDSMEEMKADSRVKNLREHDTYGLHVRRPPLQDSRKVTRELAKDETDAEGETTTISFVSF